ncbi:MULTISPECIES: conjugative transposon protein TraM [unclassified Sphingobacterium]|uniref:conjugative transposon protein TraM n=1 Tax=unclassified Sphingobacterium TaxID=2609468 RepID=UPI0020C20EC8|nr:MULTISPECIES: conjugative transposon protein TraM [unclassified Sphingobacterium]
MKQFRWSRRKQQLLFAAPLLILPVAALGFWSMENLEQHKKETLDSLKNGTLLDVPQAQVSSKEEPDKMDLYANSVFLEDGQPITSVPLNENWNQQSVDSIHDGAFSSTDDAFMNLEASNEGSQQVAVLEKRLLSLQAQLNQQRPPLQENQYENMARPLTSPISSDVQRLELLMEKMETGNTEDPELAQLSSMLEKIISIQHPERLQQEMQQEALALQPAIYEVTGERDLVPRSLMLDNVVEGEVEGFFGLGDPGEMQLQKENAIQAEIYGEQTVVNGSTLRISLREDVQLAGSKLKKGSMLFGVVGLQGDRLQVRISGIRMDQSLLPVELALFDLDGIAGIYIPGSIAREGAKNALDQGIQAMRFSELNESLSGKAIDVGIDAAKDLLARKAKLIKVTIKDGYRVLLKQK